MRAPGLKVARATAAGIVLGVLALALLDFRGAMPPGRLGIAATGDFKMSFGYATNSGLMLIDEVVTKWWLVAVPPGYDALLAGDAKAKPPVKPSKGK